MANHVHYEGPDQKYVTFIYTWNFWNTMTQQITKSFHSKREKDTEAPKLIILNQKLVPIQTEIITDGNFRINDANSTATICNLTEFTGLRMIKECQICHKKP